MNDDDDDAFCFELNSMGFVVNWDNFQAKLRRTRNEESSCDRGDSHVLNTICKIRRLNV